MPKYIVRYGVLRSLGVMTSRNDAEYRRSAEVIVRSDRGLEIGQVLCEATDDALSNLDQPPVGQIVRAVAGEDVAKIDQIDGAYRERMAICQKHITALGLNMKLVEIEQLFGGERIVVFYLSEERVDFRELVKLLASEFQTRIEMKQIGVRDEAKLLADFGDCGKEVCCNTHLVTMPPVSMKMAKLQKATLDPTKISGRCGRLKCCLRYEFDTYEAIQKELPRVGAQIVTRDGKARVLSQQIISEQLLIETEDHRRMVIDASEVLSVIKRSGGSKPQVESAGESNPDSQTPPHESRKRPPRRGSKSDDSTLGRAKPQDGGESTGDPESGARSVAERDSSGGTSSRTSERRRRGGRNRRPGAVTDVSNEKGRSPTDTPTPRPRREPPAGDSSRPASDEGNTKPATLDNSTGDRSPTSTGDKKDESSRRRPRNRRGKKKP